MKTNMIWQLETILINKQQIAPLPEYKGDFPAKKMIRSAFTLHYPNGNTSFAEKGTNLPVSAICKGDKDNIIQGSTIAFIDHNEKIREYGIDKYITGYTEQTGTPVFICDNHNIVLEAWQLLKINCPTLIHIDQHRDNAKALQLDSMHHARICDYIDFAIQHNWIKKEIISIIESGDLKKMPLIPETNKICNIDLDIFAPECTVLSPEEKIDIIYKAIAGCSLITIATSPGFIDQKLAIEIAKLLWKYI
jgi:hypothetical protein